MIGGDNIQFLIIDLFCGAGGWTCGIEGATVDGQRVAQVIAAVNHDANAIESHAANHPDTLHFFEDIRTLAMEPLVKHVKDMCAKYPAALVVLHASLECTNFSKAKGGKPRDADSRTLADHLDRYVQALHPDYITIENVVEFMSWGPLDAKGKPLSRKAGSDYMRWRNRINSYGYTDQWRELNSANFGAYTSRNRLFGIFAAHGLPIVWPEPTHAKLNKKRKGASLFMSDSDIERDGSKPWKPVREVLDLTDKGESIFTRKKALSDKTMERVYAGLIKFVAGGRENYNAWMVKFNSTNGATGKVSPGVDISETCPVVSTQNRLYLAQPEFLQASYGGKHDGKIAPLEKPARTVTSKYFSGKPDGKNISLEGPAGTVKTIDSQALVQPEFLQLHYTGGGNIGSVLKPCPTLSTKDRVSVVSPQFIMRDFSNGDNTKSIEQPAGAVMPFPKMNLVSSDFITSTNYNGVQKSVDDVSPTVTSDRHWHYLVNPQYLNGGWDVERPCFTLIARMDKAPPYLIEVEGGLIAIEVYETDSPHAKLIKQFMAMYGIVDIKMRMLRILELLKIQGFPDGYQLKGNQSEQKKYIGNAVVPIVAQRMAEALATKIIDERKAAA